MPGDATGWHNDAMQRSILLRAVLLSLVAAILAAGVLRGGGATAAEPNAELQALVRKCSGSPAELYLTTGPRHYFAVFGQWPKTWKDVTDASFVQVPLLDAQGRAVTPDDQLLGTHDCRYVYIGGQQPPVLHRLDADGNVYIVEPHKDWEPDTWSSLVSRLQREGRDDTFLTRVREDVRLKKLLSFTASLRDGIELHIAVHGRAPASWTAYLASGLAPVDAHAVSPYRDKPLVVDGTNYNMHYSSSGGAQYLLYVSSTRGKPLWDGPYL